MRCLSTTPPQFMAPVQRIAVAWRGGDPMTTRLARCFTVALLVAALALLQALVAQAAALPTAASGSGQLTLGGESRTFAFTAHRAGDGAVRGEAQLNNRLGGAMLHIAIDCLKVVGNVAIISGTVTRSNLPAEVGQVAGFAVEDNGAGKTAPPDRITLVATFPPYTTACTLYEPADFDPYFLPIDGGDVQVR